MKREELIKRKASMKLYHYRLNEIGYRVRTLVADDVLWAKLLKVANQYKKQNGYYNHIRKQG